MNKLISHSSAVAAMLLVPLAASAMGLEVMIDGVQTTFVDVSQSAWFTPYVRQSAEAGIVSGYRDRYDKPTGKFGPSNNITVAEALKIASEGAGYDESAYAAKVPSGVDHWSSAYVSVSNAEHFQVMDKNPRLDKQATRAEVAALIVSSFRVSTQNRFIGTSFKDVGQTTVFAASIEALAQDDVITGDTDVKGQVTGTFRPSSLINRAEVAKIIIRAREVYGTPGSGRLPPEETSGTSITGNVVSYTSAGFSPAVLHIKKDQAVIFRNDSTGGLWVASDPHPTHTDLPGFDSLRGILQGQVYSYAFTQVGTFGYHNHLNASFHGTIIVEEN